MLLKINDKWSKNYLYTYVLCVQNKRQRGGSIATHMWNIDNEHEKTLKSIRNVVLPSDIGDFAVPQSNKWKSVKEKRQL